MRIGVPAEVKVHEYRVSLTPAGASTLVAAGHQVFLQSGAGVGSRFEDEAYAAAGAQIVSSAEGVWDSAEMVLKVKEPVEQEYARMQRGQILFTYLHLAADPRLTRELVERGVTAIAYETVQTPDGRLPLLAPMSEVAGRLAAQAGAQTLLHSEGGRGTLVGGVAGVPPAKVVVIGAGVSGMNAAVIASGMQADVTLLDVNLDRLREASLSHAGRIRTLASSQYAIEEAVLEADLVIGAVLVPGAKAPTLVSNDIVSRMKPGAVLVDIAIDQGGCFEDSRATTHVHPTYRVHDAIFYCVANMPGAVPNTSTRALTNATLPFVTALADKGWTTACTDDPALARGVNTHAGSLTNAAVADATGLAPRALAEVLDAGVAAA